MVQSVLCFGVGEGRIAAARYSISQPPACWCLPVQRKPLIGLFAALFLVLSSGAHGLLGWPTMMQEIAKTNAPPDLVRGLRVGWLFGSACMAIFGIVLTRHFLRRRRGQNDDTVPVQLIASGYLLFGVWALVVSDFDPFYSVFIVPGLLLLFAASGLARSS